jgi:hypothetical protein
MNCNCRASGECWHFTREEWDAMTAEANKMFVERVNTLVVQGYFKPCAKGSHNTCAKVNVFDPSSVCACLCHGGTGDKV